MISHLTFSFYFPFYHHHDHHQQSFLCFLNICIWIRSIVRGVGGLVGGGWCWFNNGLPFTIESLSFFLCCLNLIYYVRTNHSLVFSQEKFPPHFTNPPPPPPHMNGNCCTFQLYLNLYILFIHINVPAPAPPPPLSLYFMLLAI